MDENNNMNYSNDETNMSNYSDSYNTGYNDSYNNSYNSTPYNNAPYNNTDNLNQNMNNNSSVDQGNANTNYNSVGQNSGGYNNGFKNSGSNYPRGQNPGAYNPGSQNYGSQNPGTYNYGNQNLGGNYPGNQNPGAQNYNSNQQFSNQPGFGKQYSRYPQSNYLYGINTKKIIIITLIFSVFLLFILGKAYVKQRVKYAQLERNQSAEEAIRPVDNKSEETTEMITERITKEATEASTEKTTEEQKPDRNGWDENTNVSYSFDDYTIVVPSYLSEYKSDDKDVKLALEGDEENVLALIMIADLEKQFDYRNIKTSNIVGVYESIEKDYFKSCEMIDSEISSYAGMENTKKAVRKYNVSDGDKNDYVEIEILFDGNKGNAVIVFLINEKDAEYDYSKDFAYIEDSIESGSQTKTNDSVAGIRPEFKEMMDSYEAFIDEYVSFMKNMNNDPTDFSYISDYADMLQKELEWAEKIDKLDESEMSTEEAAYYLEVTARCSKKLLEVSSTLDD